MKWKNKNVDLIFKGVAWFNGSEGQIGHNFDQYTGCWVIEIIE